MDGVEERLALAQEVAREAGEVGPRFFRAGGGGAFLNGARLVLPAGLTVRKGLTAIGASHRASAEELAGVVGRLLAAGGMFYRNGSGAAMLAYVAAGRLASRICIHGMPLAGLLLVEEAGASRRTGRPARSPRARSRSPRRRAPGTRWWPL